MLQTRTRRARLRRSGDRNPRGARSRRGPIAGCGTAGRRPLVVPDQPMYSPLPAKVRAMPDITIEFLINRYIRHYSTLVSLAVPAAYGQELREDSKKPRLHGVLRWWGRGDLNPHALRHMILSHARLPIPTLPRYGGLFPSPGLAGERKRKGLYASDYSAASARGQARPPGRRWEGTVVVMVQWD